MTTQTISNDIPFVPENTLDPAAGLNLAIKDIDALLQISVLGFIAEPPDPLPESGSRYIVLVGIGDFAGYDGKIAQWNGQDGFWTFYTAYYCVNQANQSLYGFFGGEWKVLATAA